MRGRRTIFCALALAAALLLRPAASVHAQEKCSDENQCTANDMCSDGTCTGSFQSGGCDDGDPCTKNDHCEMDPDIGPVCRGDQPADEGTPCGGGCGTCQLVAPFPGAPVEVDCVGDPADAGKTCDLGFENCVTGSCNIIAPTNFALCFPVLKQCPDTDGNPCTDMCDFQTGECVHDASPCIPTCETCNPTSGACEPTNEGASCDDFDVCTTQSHCEATDLGGGIIRGVCNPGAPTATCTGDCDGNGVVVVNEMVTGVNIALGSAPVSQCPAFDKNQSGGVEVNELIGGVNSLLSGCA